MTLSRRTIEKAWDQSGQQCECTRNDHGHEGRCRRAVVWENRCRDGTGGWEQRYKHPDGGDVPGNCQILCYDCYRKTRASEKW